MNSLDRCFFYLACLSVAGFAAVSALPQKAKRSAVACTIVRVVDDSTDPGVYSENTSRTYTVVLHQPAWTAFHVSGDLGKPGETVFVVPPEKDLSFSTH